MQLYDTHAHLDDERFASDLPGVLSRAAQAGVAQILAVATTATSSQTCIEIARRYPEVAASVGTHPTHLLDEPPDAWDQIVRLADEPEVVALGETGLDLYWKQVPLSLQQDYFERHLRLSQQTNLPFIVHMRECEPEVLAMLREARTRGPLSGVMHSYTGTPAGAAECVALGLHISFAGMVTYPRNADLRSTASEVPLDRILVETDSPYLSPHPHRSRRPNEPELVLHTAECLALARGISFTEFAAATWANSQRLFRRRR